jgi:hypothetical protein
MSAPASTLPHGVLCLLTPADVNDMSLSLMQAYAQQFTPRVGRLVVHHPSHNHSHGPGSWKGLTVLKVRRVR